MARTPIPTSACLLLLLFGVAVVLGPAGPRAGAEPEPERSLAEAFLAHVEAEGEADALVRLHQDGSDPWILAEQLAVGGRVELALHVADAGLTGDADALRVYLESEARPSDALVEGVRRADDRLRDGEAEKALAHLAPVRGNGFTVTEVRAEGLEAAALRLLGRDGAADTALEGAAARAGAIGWHRGEIEARVALLDRIPEGEQPARRRRILTRLVSIDQDVLDLGRSAVWCARLGALELQLGSPRLARAWLLEAVGLLDALAVAPGLTGALPEERVRALTDLADLHRGLGEAADCLSTVQRAQELAADSPPAQRLRILAILAGAHALFARYEEARAVRVRALALAEQELPAFATPLRGDLALLHVTMGNHDEAQRLYRQVLASDLVRESRRAAFVVRLHLASAGLESRAPEGREARCRGVAFELMKLLRELEAEPATFRHRAEIETHAKALLGHAFNQLDRPDEAEPFLRAVIDAPYAAEEPPLQQYARLKLARSLRLQGRPRDALQVLDEALARLEGEIARLPATLALSRLGRADTSELVEEAYAAARALRAPQRLVETLEATHGVAFRAEVERRGDQHAARPAAGAAQVELGRREDVVEATRAYWEAHASGHIPTIRDTRDTLWRRRRGLRDAAERAALADALRTSRKPAARPREPPPTLPPDEAFLYFEACGDEILVAAVARRRVQVFSLGARGALEALLGEASRAWEASDEAEAEGALSRIGSALVPAELVAWLTGGGAAEGATPAHVYVSAGGALATAPWPALLQDRMPDAAPTVSLVASQRVLQHLRVWTFAQRGGPLLALGDPDYLTQDERPLQVLLFGGRLGRLEESGAEVEEIVRRDSADAALLGVEANEQRLRHLLFHGPEPFDILHLSCHGRLYQPAPWASALALHAVAGEDGLLTVAEVSDWQFRRMGPNLVVLAACQSGLGVPVPGEGEEGLVRAFHLAGARHVVASLWRVPDVSSRRLMVAFYRHLREDGLSPAAALRAAQQDVRRVTAHPGHWAGWAIWGPRD